MWMSMKFRIWREYGALNSKPIFDAFEHSIISSGHSVVNDDTSADVNVIWSVLFNGRMGPNQTIWNQSKPTIVLEVGGIKRGTTWKVGVNGINRDAYFGPNNNNSDRHRLLGLSLKPWSTDGEFILIAGQHDKSLQWKNMVPMSSWVMDTIDTIRTHSDRPILFRPHPRCPLHSIEHQFKNVYRQNPIQLPNSYDDFDLDFNRIYATVSWSSNPGIHSVIDGVPAFVGPSSLAYDVANTDLSQINNPLMPDRQQWLNDYAHTEWTVTEIADGLPLTQLENYLETKITS
tara:strand:- start:11203 stop:12066 length:864 start_codon:yes stop_codon:yes gene_type:complete